jgi:hypothetical protein
MGLSLKILTLSCSEGRRFIEESFRIMFGFIEQKELSQSLDWIV